MPGTPRMRRPSARSSGTFARASRCWPMADLAEPRAFLAVVEHGSAKAAADALGFPRQRTKLR